MFPGSGRGDRRSSNSSPARVKQPPAFDSCGHLLHVILSYKRNWNEDTFVSQFLSRILLITFKIRLLIPLFSYGYDEITEE